MIPHARRFAPPESQSSGLFCYEDSRMGGLDAGVPGEILFVEGQNALHGMHVHCRHQSRIMNLNAGDMVRDEQFAPFLMNCQSVWQEPQLVLKETCPAVGFLRRKTVPVALKRPSAGIPEFSDVLRCVAEYCVALKYKFDGRNHQRIVAIIWLDPAKKDVAVN